jgi:hypothetical protein
MPGSAQRMPDDDVDDETAREGLELELMEHDASEEGEQIGEQLD